MIKKLTFLVILAISACNTHAVNLLADHYYRLQITLSVKTPGTLDTFTAVRNSKFTVVSKMSTGEYLVRFERIYLNKNPLSVDAGFIQRDKIYILPVLINGVIEVSTVAKESMTGLAAGPLIVPFKFRMDDDSVSGDATVGMYAGMTFEPGCTKSNWCFRITPLISAGISQVSVLNSDNEQESKSSATWAAGFLITNWADMNIGLIYGQDRIGDKDWEHEGEGWVSVMIGWDI